jgi:hypothetical protein
MRVNGRTGVFGTKKPMILVAAVLLRPSHSMRAMSKKMITYRTLSASIGVNTFVTK